MESREEYVAHSDGTRYLLVCPECGEDVESLFDSFANKSEADEHARCFCARCNGTGLNAVERISDEEEFTAGTSEVPWSHRERAMLYNDVLVAFGIDKQMIVAIEELAEVQQCLCKCIRGKPDVKHLAEEIADAEIMLEQMKQFLALEEWVDVVKTNKLNRLVGKLVQQEKTMRQRKE